MKKGNLFRGFILMLIFTLCGIEIILFSEKVHEITLIKNVRKNVNKQIGEDITVVDVTGIVIGEETEHEHIYKTMYDDTKYWKEYI